MIEVKIPPSEKIVLKYLCLDLNGTLSFDRAIIEGVPERLDRLKDLLDIRVITGDTFGNAADLLKTLPVSISITAASHQGQAKLDLVEKLGAGNTVSLGNGHNDRLMLERSALSIAVIGREGAAGSALRAARISVFSILDGLDLLLYPDRIKATLRD
ncbi:MAG: ATPase P [Candidatus Adiutrix sp.]|jgi:soluble P-type ATPase|nr:ATPase P [Candidatus Adiutrix sp.]